jgi:hypothetical protein
LYITDLAKYYVEFAYHLLFGHNNETGTKLTSRAAKVMYGHRVTKRFNIDLLVELSTLTREPQTIVCVFRLEEKPEPLVRNKESQTIVFFLDWKKKTRDTCQKQIRPKRISLYAFSSQNLTVLISYFISVSIDTLTNPPKRCVIMELAHAIDQQGQLGSRSTKLSSDPMFRVEGSNEQLTFFFWLALNNYEFSIIKIKETEIMAHRL